MCSNTSISSGCNGNNGEGVAHHGRAVYSKKPKRPRVPRRGPGVAELEKILREQENKSDLFQTNNEGFSLFTSFSKSPIHIPSFNSPSKPYQLSSSDLECLSPSKIALNNGHDERNFQIGGSQIFLPEHTLLPAMWDSEHSTYRMDGRKTFPVANQQFSSLHTMQKVQYSSPSIIDVCPNTAVSSAATTSTVSGLRDSGMEPPSNQVSYHRFNSFLPDEDKMVGTKRVRTYSMDLPDIPAFQQPVQTYCHQKIITETSLPYLVNFQATDAASRDLKIDGSSEPNSRSQNECFNFDHRPYQDGKEREDAFQERTASGDRSVEKKAVHSFLRKKDQTNFNLNDEAEEDAIDLNLKL